jgi:hypothetical protein
VINTSIAYVKNNQENRGKRERETEGKNKWKKEKEIFASSVQGQWK